MPGVQPCALPICTLLWMDLHNRLVWVALGSTLAFAFLGFIDDYLHVVHPRRRGLSVRAKFAGQITVGLVVGGILMWLSSQGSFSTQLAFPVFKELSPFLGWMYLPFATLVLVAAPNAVNLTDGLDGLAAGTTLIAAGTYTVFAYLAGHFAMANYLNIIYVPDAAEVTVFVGALVGGFLIGITEQLGRLYMGESLGVITISVIFILVLLFRPTGLFGQRSG